MSLILNELSLRNFRSWKSLHLTDIDQIGLCLINGPNGSGKSSLRQAIEYLLLDSISDGFKVEDIPFDKSGDCEIYCKIFNGDDVIEITKYRDHKQFINKIILSVNGNTSLTSTDRRVTQREIESLLGISSNEVYISTIFTVNSPSFPGAKDSERKEVLYNARGLNKYNGYQEVAKGKVSSTEAHINALNTTLINLNTNLLEVSARLVELERRVSTFDEEKKGKIAKKLREKAEYEEKDITKLKEGIQDLGELNLNGERKNIKLYEGEINELRIKKGKLETELNTIQKEFKKIKGGICPVLGSECETLLKEKGRLESETMPKINEINFEIIKLIETSIKAEGFLKRYKKIDLDHEQARAKLLELKSELKRVEEYNGSIDKMKLKYDLDIEEVAKGENPYIVLKERESEKIEDIKRNIEVKQAAIYRGEELLKYYKFWVKGFGKEGIPNLKVEAFLEQIERETNEILSGIAERLFVKVESQSTVSTGDVREKISYDVISADRRITDYASYSGGQKQRVKIADIFSFNKLIGKFNFIILDEVLELSLDERGKGEILELLKKKYLSGQVPTIFVISHDDQIKGNFNKVINVGIKDGVSYIGG